MSDVQLQSLVSRQLPEFVREDFPAFIEFLKAYYEYLETVDARNIEDLRDIDKTIYDYIIFFSNELSFMNTPNAANAFIDPVLYLRKSKQTFTAKGTEDTFKFLFRVLFNKNVDISYPWDSVLKVSDGKWNQDTSIFVTINSGDVYSLLGNKVSVTGPSTSVGILIDKVVGLGNNVYEIFIDKNYYGTINIGDSIISNTVNASIISTASTYKVVNAGTDYKPGDLISVNDGSIFNLMKVSKVNSAGGIVKLSPVNYSSGYANDFTYTDPKGAVITFMIGAVAKYQGYYISNDGFLDDAIKIQDSKYYQKYSYLLKSDEPLYAYKSFIKSFIHAAGLALYSEFQIQNVYNPEVAANEIVSITQL